MLWGNDFGQGGWASRGTTPQGWETHRHWAHSAAAITRVVVGLGDPVARGLASTGRRDGGWVCREFQMAEDWSWPHDSGHMWEAVSPHPSYSF